VVHGFLIKNFSVLVCPAPHFGRLACLCCPCCCHIAITASVAVELTIDPSGSHDSSRSGGCRRRMHLHSRRRRGRDPDTCTNRCEQEGHASAYSKRENELERARWGQTDQLPPEQPVASRRRARPPSTSPMVAESCSESGRSYALPSDGSTQPLEVESIASWTSSAYRFPGMDLAGNTSSLPTSAPAGNTWGVPNLMLAGSCCLLQAEGNMASSSVWEGGCSFSHCTCPDATTMSALVQVFRN